MALTHIDCFSGPGGICTGLHAAGFETKVAIEYIKNCVDTYSYNHPEVHVIHSDIRDVLAEDILPYVPEDGIDLVTSGMPCETFQLQVIHLVLHMMIGNFYLEKVFVLRRYVMQR